MLTQDWETQCPSPLWRSVRYFVILFFSFLKFCLYRGLFVLKDWVFGLHMRCFIRGLFFSPGITDSLSSYESYYMSGNSDADTSSDSGSLDALSSYHYDVSYIINRSFLWLKEEGPQCIQQGSFSTQFWNKKRSFLSFQNPLWQVKANVEPVRVTCITTERYFHSETSRKELGATRKRFSLFTDCTIFYGKKRRPVTERLTFVMIRWEEFNEKMHF